MVGLVDRSEVDLEYRVGGWRCLESGAKVRTNRWCGGGSNRPKSLENLRLESNNFFLTVGYIFV